VEHRPYSGAHRLLSRGFRILLAALVGVAVVLPTAPGTASAAPPAGFEDVLVTDVSGPMDVAWTADGRMLIISKAGLVRIYQGGALLATPALDLAASLCTNGERGLTGLAVHPNFAVNHFIYLAYTYNRGSTACPEDATTGPMNRLARFVLQDTNVIDPASETVLFESPPMYKDHHTGGDVKFGKDGLIYVTVGDSGAQSLGWPQDLGRLAGKIVRVTDSGGIPAGNPFSGPGTARCNAGGVPPAGSPAGTICQEIFSYGFRNPFRFAHDPNAAGVRFYVNDVGQHSWEDISEGPVAGGNYGWQLREGPCAKDSTTDCGSVPGMIDPVHWYAHGPFGAAATAGAFVPTGVWPAEYDGKYLFADYVFGKIYRLDPAGPACLTCSPPTSAFNQVEFGDFAQVVSMRFGPDNSLYYVSRDGSQVRRITYVGAGNRAPTARIIANPTSGPTPLLVQFDGTTSSDPDADPLTYSWDFDTNGTEDSTAPAPAHTYSTDGSVQASLTVNDGRGGTNTATVSIDPGNSAPEPVIISPAAGTQFAVGDVFTLQGSATDEGVSLPDAALSWEVVRHHATHTHPVLEPTTGNGLQIVGPEPEDIDAAQDSYLEIRLTATDSGGASRTVSMDLMPKKVALTFQTDPTGLSLSVGGTSISGPATVESWQAYQVPVTAPDQATADGRAWAFASWSDGGARLHTITTPATPATYTATFIEVEPQAVSFAPVADSYVEASRPTRNNGTKDLRVDGSPVLNAYLRFDVQGATDFSSVKLRIFFKNATNTGIQVRGVSNNTWGETTITYNNAPGFGPVAATSGPAGAGTWVTVDVSSLVSQNGLISFAFTTSSSTALTIYSRESATPPELIVGSEPSPSPFVVSKVGSSYQAVSATTGQTFSGTLKSVVENAVSVLGAAGGGTISFTAGLFDLGSDHFELYNISNLTFEGQGMGVTTIRNVSNAASDTEPFDVVGADGIVVRDMTVEAGGALRTTSDALDFDNGANILVERVAVTVSRARGIIFDGKGAGWSANGNVVRDCVITGIPGDGIEFLASSSNLVEGCSISNVGGHGIQVNKSSTSAAQPNKKSNDNIVRNNTIDNAGQDGINITSGDRNQVTANTITNSSDDTSGRDGIRVASSDSITCDDNAVNGNLATDNQPTKTQSYGLNIASALCHRTVVGVSSPNDFTGNLVGPIRDLATDTIYPPPVGDNEPPTQPTSLNAVAVSACRVDLSWDASTDNVGVTGYGIYRGGALIASVGGSTLSFQDTTVSPATPYSYTVDAVDAATNRSIQSAPSAVTTPSGACSLTFVPIADSWVDASQPDVNFGTSTQVRVDGTPVVVTYLKFDVQVAGSISSATLRIFANSTHSVGFSVRPVADSSWSEATITYTNAPVYGSVAGTSGAFNGGTWVVVDVTSLVTANGQLSLALTTTSSTAMSLASLQSGANAPQLIISQ